MLKCIALSYNQYTARNYLSFKDWFLTRIPFDDHGILLPQFVCSTFLLLLINTAFVLLSLLSQLKSFLLTGLHSFFRSPCPCQLAVQKHKDVPDD